MSCGNIAGTVDGAGGFWRTDALPERPLKNSALRTEALLLRHFYLKMADGKARLR
ncbi:MAG: hypothetical protein LBH50_01850 [Spirochaetaceae bacterium]|nr:hypothetical protein [Spirochaetaceae bacterium]